jgi:integrase
MRKKSSEGIVAKHSRSCASRDDKNCNCKRTYQAWVWSKRDQKKLYKTFPTLAAAKGWRSDASGNVRRGAMRGGPSVTLNDAANEWLEKAEGGEILSRHRKPYKPSTLRGYRDDLENHVLPDLGALRLAEVTADDLQELVGRLIVAGFSGSKVRNVIVAVQAVYRHNRRRVLVNPARDLDLPETGGTREWDGTPEDAKAYIDAAREEERAMWATAFYAGLRAGELRALRVDDLHGMYDDGERWISVAHGWDDREGEIAPKSSASVRLVPFPETLRSIVAAQLVRTERSGRDLVFGKTAIEPFVPWTIGDHATKAWEKAKLPRITLHHARHGYRSFLEDTGISEARCDRYMGHASGKVGRRYLHRIAGQLAADAKQLDAYLAGESASVTVLRPWKKATGAQSGAQSAQRA